jgi:hypothetical protein
MVNKLSGRSTIWIRKLLPDWIKTTEDQGQKPGSNAGLLATLNRWGNKCIKPKYDRARSKLKKKFPDQQKKPP